MADVPKFVDRALAAVAPPPTDAELVERVRSRFGGDADWKHGGEAALTTLAERLAERDELIEAIKQYQQAKGDDIAEAAKKMYSLARKV